MDQPIRRKVHHSQMPAVRVPVPCSPRHAYEVRVPHYVVCLQGGGLELGFYERTTVALRNSLEGAMESAVVIGAQHPTAACTP